MMALEDDLENKNPIKMLSMRRTGGASQPSLLHCKWTDQLWQMFIHKRKIKGTKPGRITEFLKCWNSDGNAGKSVVNYGDAHKQVTDALKLEKTAITKDEEPHQCLRSVMACTVKKTWYSCELRRRRRRAWDIAPLEIMWIIWKERNRRAFHGVKKDFVHLRNILFSLISFWCTMRIVVRPTMMYGEVCWLVKNAHIQKMNVAAMRMLWMCRHTRRDKIRNEVMRGKVGVTSVADKMREVRLRCFRHVKRRCVGCASKEM
ncbi:hypothetical protein H5410_029013 [Solanum commersonii]|uniref:Uncharacterized protein n=1 Tax=Solanum commersonii TaxID=4109 RepID=A0A9J5Z3S1_SOLCO|nr:hypothetical protein H5410_029013 [Solanum commersonii]